MRKTNIDPWPSRLLLDHSSPWEVERVKVRLWGLEGRPAWNRLTQHDCCTASELSWEGRGEERRRAEEGEGGGRRLGIRKFLIASALGKWHNLWSSVEVGEVGMPYRTSWECCTTGTNRRLVIPSRERAGFAAGFTDGGGGGLESLLHEHEDSMVLKNVKVWLTCSSFVKHCNGLTLTS